MCDGSAAIDTHRREGASKRLLRPALAVFGIALLVASGLKAYDGAVHPAASAADSLLPGWAQLPLAELELLLGLWFVSGLRIQAARRVGVLAGCCLAAYSLFAAVTGRKSCGCFGRIVINPWWTLSFDIAILAALLTAVSGSSPVDSSRFALPRFRRGLISPTAVPVRCRRMCVRFCPLEMACQCIPISASVSSASELS